MKLPLHCPRTVPLSSSSTATTCFPPFGKRLRLSSSPFSPLLKPTKTGKWVSFPSTCLFPVRVALRLSFLSTSHLRCIPCISLPGRSFQFPCLFRPPRPFLSKSIRCVGLMGVGMLVSPLMRVFVSLMRLLIPLMRPAIPLMRPAIPLMRLAIPLTNTTHASSPSPP